jgi:hypothetical protein
MENKNLQEISKDDLNEIITSYKWIKVIKFDEVIGRDDDIEFMYNGLLERHREETEFLINKCRELASLLLDKQTKKERIILSQSEQNIIDNVLVDHDINVNNGVSLDIVLSCDLALREYAKLKNSELQNFRVNMMNFTKY